MRALLLHWPHILPIVVASATLVYLWRADRRYRAGAPTRPAARKVALPRKVTLPRKVALPVKREAARRGVLVLVPLLGALVTGAVLYGIDLAGMRPGEGLIWTHVGLSALLCLLAVYKLVGIEAVRTLGRLSLDRAIAAGGSLLLALLLVPILITGLDLLADPSRASFAANLHLIASAWWTLLALWHLARYLGRSLRAWPHSEARASIIARSPPPRQAARDGWPVA
jgi:hypothetical protein